LSMYMVYLGISGSTVHAIGLVNVHVYRFRGQA
jgi:hypothetical protein